MPTIFESVFDPFTISMFNADLTQNLTHESLTRLTPVVLIKQAFLGHEGKLKEDWTVRSHHWGVIIPKPS